jgi:hypothetical protein
MSISLHPDTPEGRTLAAASVAAAGATAMPPFAALVDVHAEDELAGFHLKQLLNGAKASACNLNSKKGKKHDE